MICLIIDSAKKGGIVSTPQYNRVLDFVVSHLYVANPQSRIGCINRMNLRQYQELHESGRTGCHDFKTWDKFAVQYVNACPATIA